MECGQTDEENDIPDHIFKIRVSQGGVLEIFPPSSPDNNIRTWISLMDLFSEKKGDADKSTLQLRKKDSAVGNSYPMKRKGTVTNAARLSLISRANVNKSGGALATSELGDYFEALLRLYQALCAGQNTEVISLMVNKWRVISLNICEIALANGSLPANIRALFCDLIRVMFVDKFPLPPSMSDYIFSMSSIDHRPRLRAVLQNTAVDDTKLQVDRLLVITEWISHFLTTCPNLIYKDKDRNELILSTLKLLKFLVSFGFVTDETGIVNLFQTLTEILDGRSDMRYFFVLSDPENVSH